ncbi:RGG repeats nuclear RNA binding protein B-like protein [Drosera capensis]
MASSNPFDLLKDDDSDDPSALIAAAAAQQHKGAESAAVAVPKKGAAAGTAKAAASAAKLPTKPVPPAQAVVLPVRDAKNDASRGGGRGYGRGRGGFNRESFGNEKPAAGDNGFSSGNRSLEDKESGRPFERRDYGERRDFGERRDYGERRESGGQREFVGPRGGFRGGRRGGFSNGEIEEGDRPRRPYERRSGTGRGNEFKKDGAGRGNWGTATDEIPQGGEEPLAETETNVVAEKLVEEEQTVDAEKDARAKEPEEKEPEEKQMTLEEYEKVLEEKRKALLALKAEERKVDLDKEFESMQLVSKKKNNDEIFVRLGSEKDKKREAAPEREERSKKAVSINEFLKPSEGDSYYRPGGRGRGRGRGGPRGGFDGGYASNRPYAPSIEDPGQFPSLGGK